MFSHCEEPRKGDEANPDAEVPDFLDLLRFARNDELTLTAPLRRADAGDQLQSVQLGFPARRERRSAAAAGHAVVCRGLDRRSAEVHDHPAAPRPRLRAIRRPARRDLCRQQSHVVLVRSARARERAGRLPARARHSARRPRRHLGAEPRRVALYPVRHRADRRDPGQHQPGVSCRRTRIRTQQSRMQSPGNGAPAQVERLRQHAPLARVRTRQRWTGTESRQAAAP